MTGDAGLPVTALAEASGPRQRLGIGILGYGSVARRWQVPSYLHAGLDVVAICDTDPEALQAAEQSYPSTKLYSSAEAMLADPNVAVVDIATRPPGRLHLIRQSVEAGRHVLAQKPLASDPHAVADLADLARRAGVTVAVNQNGRFAPAWREAAAMLHAGAIGRIRAVTHTFDTRLRWLPDPRRHGPASFLLFDYANHWIDISGWWLHPDPVVAVQAMAYESARYPNGEIQQSGWIAMETASGANVVISAAAAGVTHAGHTFLIQGDAGTLRGSVDAVAGEHLELDDGASVRQVPIDGEWFPDGFRGAMEELLDAVSSGRLPVHSLAENIRTVALVDAVCASAAAKGARVEVRWPADLC